MPQRGGAAGGYPGTTFSGLSIFQKATHNFPVGRYLPLTIDNNGFIYEQTADNLTAHAGGGQGSALLLTAQMNRVTTVATAGDSVALPVSIAGMELTVINNSTKNLQVFGSGTDTIDAQATAVGVTQIPNSVVIYFCVTAGAWQTEGLAVGYAGGNLQTNSAVDGLVAHAGGGQGSAVPLTAMINRVVTVASAGDSVILPASVAGANIVVANAAAANAMNVFPATGESINALAVNTAFSVVAGKVCQFYCASAGVWHALLSA